MEILNKKVIIRSDRAGVFFGTLVSKENTPAGVECEIKDCRRLWYWDGAASLSQLAVDGVSEPGRCKFTVVVPQMLVMQVIEIIPCTDKAIKSLRPQSTYNPYKSVVESIAEMCKHYDKASHSGLRDFYDNVKVKCKDAKEYDNMFPQTHWKPSDQQMTALRRMKAAIAGEGEIYKPLNSLYEDLKKLKEE